MMMVKLEATIAEFVFDVLLLVVIGGVLGFVVAWLYLNKTRPTASTQEKDEGLYLILSRVKHLIDGVRVVIKAYYMEAFTDDLPTDANRWRLARKDLLAKAETLERLNHRLALMTGSGARGQALVMQRVNIVELLEEMMMGLRELDGNNDRLKVVDHQNVPHISADLEALQEVFFILLDNALKHGGPDVKVTAKVSSERDKIKVRIVDTGVGINPHILRRVFEPGERGDQTGWDSGTGMGLPIARTLVRLHGGEIASRSPVKDGRGTEFVVSLPLRRVKATP